MIVLHFHFIDGHPMVDVQIGDVTHLDCPHDGERVLIMGAWHLLPQEYR